MLKGKTMTLLGYSNGANIAINLLKNTHLTSIILFSFIQPLLIKE